MTGVQTCALPIYDKKMAVLGRVIQEVVNSKDNPPQIIEAGKTVEDISSGIKAIMISLCLLARITNPPLFSSHGTTRRISSVLYAMLQYWSSPFGGHTSNQSTRIPQ